MCFERPAQRLPLAAPCRPVRGRRVGEEVDGCMTDCVPATSAAIARGAALLREGRLVAFPTETVYGLGADARADEAVAKVFEAKARPRFNPLIAHVASLAAAQREGLFDAAALALADAFWPGPLTLVVPAAPTCGVGLLARAGLGSVALRVPAHPVARALLREVGHPVAAPSANRSGRISPTEAAHVLAELDGRLDLVLDGGPCAVGLESTVVSCLGAPALLRPGGISREAVEAVLGDRLAGPGGSREASASPGLQPSHYAPRARVRLNAAAAGPDEAVLDYAGRLAGPRGPAVPYLDLSSADDLAEAAAHLFAYLRELDASGHPTIAVAPVPGTGLGEAINDRLRRAAAPRD